MPQRCFPSPPGPQGEGSSGEAEARQTIGSEMDLGGEEEQIATGSRGFAAAMRRQAAATRCGLKKV